VIVLKTVFVHTYRSTSHLTTLDFYANLTFDSARRTHDNLTVIRQVCIVTSVLSASTRKMYRICFVDKLSCLQFDLFIYLYRTVRELLAKTRFSVVLHQPFFQYDGSSSRHRIWQFFSVFSYRIQNFTIFLS
jgi:hypothetical protein